MPKRPAIFKGSQHKKPKLESIYENYNKLMFYTAEQILHSQKDSEKALFSAWKSLALLQDKFNQFTPAQQKTLILILTRRTADTILQSRQKKARRKRKNTVAKGADVPTGETLNSLPATPNAYSDILVLYYVYQLTTAEISKLLNMKKREVTKKINEGRSLIKHKSTKPSFLRT